MYLIYSFVSFVVVFLVRYLVEKWRFYNKLGKIPGPKPLPILGNLLDFLSPTIIMPNVERYMKQYGEIFKVYLGPIYTYIIIADPDINEYVLSSNKLIEKSHDYDFIKNWLGDGLITAPGYIWRKFRKTLTPAFHFKILEQMSSNFTHPREVLIKKLTKEAESGSKFTDIYPFITLYSLDVICETTMGIQIDAQEREDPFVTSTREMLVIMNNRIFSVIKQFDFLYHLTPDWRKELKAVDYLHRTSENVIKSRRSQLQSTKKTDEAEESEDAFGIKKKRAFLDLMLDMKVEGKPISDVEIRDNVDTIMFAGHDTTASGLAFCLYLLANNPHHQQKLYEEIISASGKNENHPTLSELNEMKYLEMVIKETLRIYPSVHLIGRNVYEDFEYKGIYYPKGVTIVMSPYLTHRNEKYYPEPEKFDPERFTPENCAKRHPYAYIPFSAGPRNCIGQKFAMISMKFAISTIIKNFELLPVPEKKMVISAEVVLKSKDGIYMQLKKRT